MSLNDLRSGFRDEAQRRRTRHAVHDRLADDRDQDECRYLMRLWWQLSASYQEVTLLELRAHIGEPKLSAVESLIDAIRASPDQIDAWIQNTERDFPIVHDRGYDACELPDTLSPPGN